MRTGLFERVLDVPNITPYTKRLIHMLCCFSFSSSSFLLHYKFKLASEAVPKQKMKKRYTYCAITTIKCL